MKVYGDIASGNCYKVKLVLNQLSIDHEWVHVDIVRGDTKTAEFLALNPNGKIPLVVLDDGEVLTESNAIINYLAMGSHLIPTDRLAYARVLEWQFFEQYSHEPYIAVARFIKKFLGLPEERRAEYESKQTGGIKALRLMESVLAQQPFLVGNQYTIADISLYAYTHVAAEGGFDLSAYPSILAWIKRVTEQDGYLAMA